MAHQDYFPYRKSEQPDWLNHLADRLPVHGPSIPLDPAVVTAGVNDCRFLAYSLGPWIITVRDFAPGCTSSLEILQNGISGAAFSLPVFTAPALPSGVTPVTAGALQRIFALVQVIKNSPGYTDSMGIDMGIVGTTATPSTTPQAPDLKAKVEPGLNGDQVILSYVKSGHAGAAMQCRRGNGAWEDIGIATKSSFTDSRPLLVAGTPEVREYRASYWDDGQASGNWSPVVKVTVGP